MRHLLTAILAAIVLGVIGTISLCGDAACDRLDGVSTASVLAELSSSVGFQFPPVKEILGYRAGLDERFVKLTMASADVDMLVARFPCKSVAATSVDYRGMDPSGIGDWWKPDLLPTRAVYEGELVGRPGAMVLIVAEGNEPDAVVFIYCIRP